MAGKYDHYKEGEKDDTGDTIQTIIGIADHLAVYIVHGGAIKIACDAPGAPTPWVSSVFSEYERLLGRINRAIPKDRSRSIRCDLASAVFNALSTDGKGYKVADFFGSVHDDLAERSREFCRAAYVIGSIIAAVPVGVFMLLLVSTRTNAQEISFFYYGIAGGAVGALVSVMQRSDKLEADPYANRYFVGLQGMLRTVLGIIFGIILVAAMKGGLLLNAAGSNVYAVFLLSTVAGFSEKFVPEILSRAEAQATKPGGTGRGATPGAGTPSPTQP